VGPRPGGREKFCSLRGGRGTEVEKRGANSGSRGSLVGKGEEEIVRVFCGWGVLVVTTPEMGRETMTDPPLDVGRESQNSVDIEKI